MAKGMSMKVLLQLQSKEFRKGIDNIKRQLKGFQNFMKSAFALGSITMFGKQMIQVSKDFEDAMARVQAVSNATTEEFKAMQAEAQRLGSTTKYTASEAASALENLTRNGMSATNATKALSQVLAMAQANSIDLATAANIMTNTLNMFGLSVQEATKVSDVLSSTASHAATDIVGISEAMANAAPAAAALGLSIEETSAAIGALAQKGIKGAEAGTQLRVTLQKLVDPKIIKKMQNYGIEISEASIKSEGLYKTLQRLKEANLSLGDLGGIFSKSAMSVQNLISGLEDVNYLIEVLKNSAGETERMMKQGVGSVQNEIATLKSMYEGLLITIGQKTGGAVKGAIRFLQNLIMNFETLGGTIANLASVAVPLLTKRIVTLVTTTKTAFANIAASATAAKVAMGDWITIIMTLVTWVGTAAVGAWNRLHQGIRDANTELAKTQTASALAKNEVKKLQEELGGGQDSLNSVLSKAIKLFPDFEDALRDAAKVAGETEDWEKLKKVLQDIADLQALISSSESKENISTAAGEAIGTTMYETTKFKGGQWYNPFISQQDINNRLYKPYVDEIERQLKLAWPKGADLSQIYKKIGVVIDKSEGQNKKIDEIQGILRQNRVSVDNSFVDRMITAVKNDASTKTFYEQGSIASYESQTEAGQAYKGVYKLAEDNFKSLKENELKNLNERKISQEEFQRRVEGYAADFIRKVDNIPNILPYQKYEARQVVKGFYPATTTSGDNGGSGGSGGSGSKGKSPTELIQDAVNDYVEGSKKLSNRLDAGTISQEDYNAELKKLVDKTWETITAVDNFRQILRGVDLSKIENAYNANRDAEAKADYEKVKEEKQKKAIEQLDNLAKNFKMPTMGKRDSRFDYAKSKNEILSEEVSIKVEHADALNALVRALKEGIINGDFDLAMGPAVKMLMNLKLAAMQASKEAETLQHKLTLSEQIAKLDEEIESLKDRAIDNIGTLSNVFDNLYRSIQNIGEALGEEVEWEGFEQLMAIVNASVQIFETLRGVIEAVKVIEQLAAKQKQKDAVKSAMANKLEAQSELEKAAAEGAAAGAGAASSVASIPVVGPALAVAAVAAVVAAIALGISKLSGFANGGIVNNGSPSGDKTLARVNQGEMILNKAQQATLWNMLNGKGGIGGGQVTFKLRGTELIGCINNEMSRRKG